MALKNGQWQVAEIVMGEGTEYQITPVDFSGPDISTQDYARVNTDGIKFGRDTQGGQTMVLDLAVLNMAGIDMWDSLERLAFVWKNKDFRNNPSSVITLRYNIDGRERLVYGRPRKFAMIPGGRKREFVNVLMEFATTDARTYSIEEHRNTVEIVPPNSGGLVAPLKAPLTTVQESSHPGSIFVSGYERPWLRTVIHGPISQPVIDITGQWKISLDLNLAYDEYVEINPYPDGGYIRKNGNENVSGSLSTDSPYLSMMVIPSGEQEIVLRGIDQSGTSYLEVFWHDTYAGI